MLLGLVSEPNKALSKTHHSLIGQLNNTGITAGFRTERHNHIMRIRQSATKRSTLTEPHAKRLKRPTVKDWRFILGVLLVLISITGVQLYVQANNSKTEYYTAKSEIRLGEKITEDKLARVEANIDSAKDKYFTRAEAAQMNGKIATQRIPAGNFISKESVGTETSPGRRLATVSIDRTAASALKAGERVDVWTSGPRNPDTKSDNRTENGARAIVTNAEIVAVTVDEGVLGANGKATVQLWVKEEALAALVKESNSDSKISLIPGTYGEGQ